MAATLRIAIVDDDASVRAQVRAALLTRGYDVVESTSAAEALALEPQNIDAMVLGLELPDLTGATVWQRLRSNEATAPFPILFVSPATTDERAIAACLTPHTDYLELPCHDAELVARLDTLVRRWQTLGDDNTVLKRASLYDVLRDDTAQTLLQHHVSGLRVIGSGLAHEMNSPLAALLASLQFAIATGDAAERAGALDDASSAAARLAAVVRRVQQMGASSDAASTVNLRQLVQEIAATFRPEAAVVEVSGDVPPLTAVKSELWALFNALLENAVEACAGRTDGKVVVTLAARTDVVDITIDDNGRGISDEDLPFVFDLFFTKKHRWSSIGLGLPIAQAAAHRQGGFVFVDGCGPLGGARVSLLLPQRPTSTVANAPGRAIRRGLWSGQPT